MTTPTEVLIRAREMLSDWQRWCQGSWAQDVVGASCPPTHKAAVAWDLIGAIERATFDLTGEQNPELRTAAENKLRAYIQCSPTWLNDYYGATHKKILEALDGAIQSG